MKKELKTEKFPSRQFKKRRQLCCRMKGEKLKKYGSQASQRGRVRCKNGPSSLFQDIAEYL